MYRVDGKFWYIRWKKLIQALRLPPDSQCPSQSRMVSLSQLKAEVEDLRSQCSFLFEDSVSEQIRWAHLSSCPAKCFESREICTCNAGVMTKRQVEAFERKLKEQTELGTGEKEKPANLKLSNIALSFLASWLSGSRQDGAALRTHDVKNPGAPQLSPAATLATSTEHRVVNNFNSPCMENTGVSARP